MHRSVRIQIFRVTMGAMMSMGGGPFQSFSKKQKLNTRSSNDSELRPHNVDEVVS